MIQQHFQCFVVVNVPGTSQPDVAGGRDVCPVGSLTPDPALSHEYSENMILGILLRPANLKCL